MRRVVISETSGTAVAAQVLKTAAIAESGDIPTGPIGCAIGTETSAGPISEELATRVGGASPPGVFVVGPFLVTIDFIDVSITIVVTASVRVDGAVATASTRAVMASGVVPGSSHQNPGTARP